jgi:hypothetical protein
VKGTHGEQETVEDKYNRRVLQKTKVSAYGFAKSQSMKVKCPLMAMTIKKQTNQIDINLLRSLR